MWDGPNARRLSTSTNGNTVADKRHLPVQYSNPVSVSPSLVTTVATFVIVLKVSSVV
jgi:hypothetical protein